MNFKRCVVSVAFRQPYTSHSLKQARAIVNDIPFISFINRYPFRGSMIEIMNDDVSHFQKHLYSFKPYAIQEAINRGYNSIIWLDPSQLPLESVNKLFDRLESNTMIVKTGDGKLSSRCNKFTSDWFGVSFEEMDEHKLPDYGGTIYGFNFTKEKAIETFNLWMKSEMAGCFGTQDTFMKGHWADETCMGLSIYKTGVETVDDGGFKFKNQKEL